MVSCNISNSLCHQYPIIEITGLTYQTFSDGKYKFHCHKHTQIIIYLYLTDSIYLQRHSKIIISNISTIQWDIFMVVLFHIFILYLNANKRHSFIYRLCMVVVQNSHNYEILKPLKYPIKAIIHDYFLCNLKKVTQKKYTNLKMDL